MKLRATCFQRVYVVKDMICNIANDYCFRRLRKIVRRQNSRVQFRFLFSSEETRSHAVFHDCHRESPECKLISQDRLGTLM